jgi:hypothetical protein
MSVKNMSPSRRRYDTAFRVRSQINLASARWKVAPLMSGDNSILIDRRTTLAQIAIASVLPKSTSDSRSEYALLQGHFERSAVDFGVP